MEDFLAVRKKTYKEKDLYIKIVIFLSRLFVNKEGNEECLWKKPPTDWNVEELGPWRSPTGNPKDSLARIKKKCDFLERRMPSNKESKMAKVKRLIKIAESGSKSEIHNTVCLLRQQDILKEKYDLSPGCNSPEFRILVQETNVFMEERRKELETISKFTAEPISNRKRSLDSRKTYCKKFKRNDNDVALPTNSNKRTYPRILPKPVDFTSQPQEIRPLSAESTASIPSLPPNSRHDWQPQSLLHSVSYSVSAAEFHGHFQSTIKTDQPSHVSNTVYENRGNSMSPDTNSEHRKESELYFPVLSNDSGVCLTECDDHTRNASPSSFKKPPSDSEQIENFSLSQHTITDSDHSLDKFPSATETEPSSKCLQNNYCQCQSGMSPSPLKMPSFGDEWNIDSLFPELFTFDPDNTSHNY